MKCCASPTTCSVDSGPALRVAQALEAALLTPILRPVSGAENDAAAYFVDTLARAVAAADRSGFAATLAADLERP